MIWDFQERTDGKGITLFPLHFKKSITFLAHLGRDKLGTVCKVEVSQCNWCCRFLPVLWNLTIRIILIKVWESVLVLRRVSDNDIIMRLWRDDIRTSLYDTNSELVILHYKDPRQPLVTLHTKQVGLCVLNKFYTHTTSPLLYIMLFPFSLSS